MRKLSLLGVAGLVAVLAVPQVHAQTAQTPQQLQGLIASGQEKAALAQLSTILQAHPQSGVAWYLTAEAQDALGNENAARGAMSRAEQYAPGLPFAQPDKVAALQAHLAGSSNAMDATTAAPAPSRGISPLVIGIGALVVLFLLVRMFFRSRRRGMVPPGFQSGYGPNGPAGTPYGPGGMPYGGGGVGMPGAGGSLLSGLAAGAGFAASERLIGGLMGGGGVGGLGGGGAIDPASNNDPAPTPDRDDGLSGSPGWDNSGGGSDPAGGGGGGDFDPNNSW